MDKIIICKDCGEKKKQEAIGLCCKCYKKQYRLKRGIIPRGKYWGVDYKYKQIHSKCAQCGTTERKHHSNGLCIICYNRKRRNRGLVCKGCQKKKKGLIKGLCCVCYNKQRHLIICAECKKKKTRVVPG